MIGDGNPAGNARVQGGDRRLDGADPRHRGGCRRVAAGRDRHRGFGQPRRPRGRIRMKDEPRSSRAMRHGSGSPPPRVHGVVVRRTVHAVVGALLDGSGAPRGPCLHPVLREAFSRAGAEGGLPGAQSSAVHRHRRRAALDRHSPSELPSGQRRRAHAAGTGRRSAGRIERGSCTARSASGWLHGGFARRCPRWPRLPNTWRRRASRCPGGRFPAPRRCFPDEPCRRGPGEMQAALIPSLSPAVGSRPERRVGVQAGG